MRFPNILKKQHRHTHGYTQCGEIANFETMYTKLTNCELISALKPVLRIPLIVEQKPQAAREAKKMNRP